MKKKPEFKIQNITHPSTPLADYNDPLLRELVAHLRQNRTQLREEWARRITDAQLLTAMTREEIFSEATSVYDNYVEVPETGSVETLQAYARNLSERIIPRGVETHEVVGIVLLLRDVLARSLFKKYQGGHLPFTRGDYRRFGPRCDRFVCHADSAGDCPYVEAARCGYGYRRHPTRRCFRDGPIGAHP